MSPSWSTRSANALGTAPCDKRLGSRSRVDCRRLAERVVRRTDGVESGRATAIELVTLYDLLEPAVARPLAERAPRRPLPTEREAALLQAGGLEQLAEGTHGSPKRRRRGGECIEDQRHRLVALAIAEATFGGHPQRLDLVGVVSQRRGQLHRHSVLRSAEPDHVTGGEPVEPALGAPQRRVVVARSPHGRRHVTQLATRCQPDP